MRVVHIIKATRISGAERHLLILLKALRERDVDAQLLMLVEPDNMMADMVAEAEALQIPIKRVVIRRDVDLATARTVRRHLRNIKPDIVHTHLIHGDVYGMLGAKLAGVRDIVMSRHNDDAFRRKVPVRWLNRWLWRQVKAGIAISESIERFAVKVEGAPSKKIHVVKYGIEHEPKSPAELDAARAALREELRYDAGALLVGLACRLVEQKGVSYALRAFAHIAHRHPDTYLIIAGDGERRRSLEALAGQLRVADRVRFTGWRSDLDRILSGLDVFMMPSLWEGFGLVLLEAMRYRLPIIASNVGAIPEVVADGESGVLVRPRDVDGLARALDALLSDRSLRLHMGLMGEDRLETHFSAGRMADETITIYHDIQTK